MKNIESRIGNFTSSEIVALTAEGKTKGTFGQKALTYIEECNMERRLGRSLSDEVNSRPTSWGKLLEKRVFDLLGFNYKICSTETLVHPTIDCWAGSPDALKYESELAKVVGDVKAPMSLKSFCQLVDPFVVHGFTGIKAIEAIANGYKIGDKEYPKHKDGEKFFYQLVSNAVLTNTNHAELIVYVPYKSELEEIRELARNWDGPDQTQFLWISYATDDELPYLIDGGYYKNLNIIPFPVGDLYKEKLTELVKKAQPLLINTQAKTELQTT